MKASSFVIEINHKTNIFYKFLFVSLKKKTKLFQGHINNRSVLLLVKRVYCGNYIDAGTSLQDNITDHKAVI